MFSISIDPSEGEFDIEEERLNISVQMSSNDPDIQQSNTIQSPKEMEPSPSAKRRRHSSSLTIEEPQLCETVTQTKEKIATRTKRKRKLRPEDERTMSILTEKFRTDQHGAICQVQSCKSHLLKSTKPSSLKRHLEHVHPEVYSNLFPQEVSAKKQIELDSYNTLQDSIELVTVNGYPFSLLNSSGMRGFIRSRLQPIRLNGNTLAINRLDIVKNVAESSDIIRNRIKTELNGKTISVMFDMCTISTLATFGVNVNYMDNGNVISRSLGIIKIEKRHTAVNLADMLYDLLAKFEIPLSKVFSITTDTAKNATNTSEILNTVMANGAEMSMDEVPEQIIFDRCPEDEDLYFGSDIGNEEELKRVIENADHHTLLAEETAELVSYKTDVELINKINCGIHVLQLAINGGISGSNAETIIAQVKKMCLLMRTQIVMIEIRKLGSKIILPPLDNTTRWNSKYLMVSMK